MKTVVTRYPVFIRYGTVLACLVLAVGIAKGPVSTRIVVIAASIVCLAIAILAYKAEIDAVEVRVRYLPFYIKRTPLREITHLAEEKTLVLVTATSKIPLWGLSAEARESLSDILPSHLNQTRTHPSRRTDSAAVVRRHVKRTIVVATAFFISLILSVPFLEGNRWNRYVDTIGKYVLFFCLCTFLLLLFQAGFTYVLWSSKRAFDSIERDQIHKRS
jgi:hypothetical protein